MLDREFILLLLYNKQVTCLIDANESPVCHSQPPPSRRDGAPSHDPYIPRHGSHFYNCTDSLTCTHVPIVSLSQLTSPKLQLRECYRLREDPRAYRCIRTRFHHMKNEDKLIFLTTNIPHRHHYLVDCLIYQNKERVCQRQEDVSSQLLDTGASLRPIEKAVISRDQLLCEEDKDGVYCDTNPYVPHNKGLTFKQSANNVKNIMLKSGGKLFSLRFDCESARCGFVGREARTRRWESPGGKPFECFYQNRQQVCKEITKQRREKKWFEEYV